MSSEIFDREREIRETRAYLCLDCGKCTAVCPVAQHSQEFNPRLIVQRNLGKNSAGTQDDTIWSCLSCYTCVERCNYRVDFPEFIHALRCEASMEGVRAHCSHGGALQSLMHVMARQGLNQERLNWLPDDVELSEQTDTLYFVGCAPYFDTMFRDIGVNTLDGVKGALKLLNHVQEPFNISANERCCGRDLLLGGDREGFMDLARANTAEFARRGIKKIITSCPECYYTLKVDYPRMLGGTDTEVVHITEILAPLAESGKLNADALEKKVTYHDPCALGRCSGIYEEPRQILAAAVGGEIAEMEQNRNTALCCGAVPWVSCGAVNREIQAERLDQAVATGAEILVTACPKCQIHLKCAQKNSESKAAKIEIQDLMYLAARFLDRR